MDKKLRLTLHALQRSIVIGIVLTLTLAVSALANTITVTKAADSDGFCPGAFCTLRQAIAVASPGDTINFSLPANSLIELTTTELVIDKDLTIEGPGALQLTVRRERQPTSPPIRVFNISRNVTISGLTITSALLFKDGPGTSGQNGGGIYYNSSTGTGLTIIRCAFEANNAGNNGGAIYFSSNGGALTITDSTIDNNAAYGGGGGIYVNSGTATITNTTIEGNQTNRGGGIYAFGNVAVTNSTIAYNTVAQGGSGGGVYHDPNSSSLVTVKNTIIAGNTRQLT
jgi:CSLREA domain-containing protein